MGIEMLKVFLTSGIGKPRNIQALRKGGEELFLKEVWG
jgi:hypothetical protein